MTRYLPSLLLLTLFGLPPAAQAGELGRLFFTPQQREQQEFQETRSNTSTDSGRRNYIIVNGVVQKHGGNRTVWINGTAQAPEQSDNRSPASETVTVPGKSHPVQLKVGQPLLLEAPAPASEEDK